MQCKTIRVYKGQCIETDLIEIMHRNSKGLLVHGHVLCECDLNVKRHAAWAKLCQARLGAPKQTSGCLGCRGVGGLNQNQLDCQAAMATTNIVRVVPTKAHVAAIPAKLGTTG